MLFFKQAPNNAMLEQGSYARYDCHRGGSGLLWGGLTCHQGGSGLLLTSACAFRENIKKKDCRGGWRNPASPFATMMGRVCFQVTEVSWRGQKMKKGFGEGNKFFLHVFLYVFWLLSLSLSFFLPFPCLCFCCFTFFCVFLYLCISLISRSFIPLLLSFSTSFSLSLSLSLPRLPLSPSPSRSLSLALSLSLGICGDGNEGLEKKPGNYHRA